jgi:formylglycine-generating enzyme required for sulfatase activity
MKTRSSNYLALISALGAALWLAAPRAPAQSPPALSVQVSNGYARLSLTGVVGSACTIQYCAGLSQTNNWQLLTNLMPLPSSPYLVADASPATATRFYRAFAQQVITNLVPTNLVWILPISFVMGSPTSEMERGTDETQHTVTLTKGFYMGKYQVTQGDYQSLIGSNPSYYKPANGYSQDLNRPVEEVSWADAVNYCEELTTQQQLGGQIPAGWTYRLPTESEWEYACRAGRATAFNFGSAIRGGMANFYDNWEYDASVGSSYVANPTVPYLNRTTTVGSYPPNDWGLYDMHGNVMEWCQDWYGTYPTGGVTDPRGPTLGSYRVVRGGCALVGGRYCRSAYRLYYAPSYTNYVVGFRVVLSQ